MPNRVNRRLSRDVAIGEPIDGSRASCISGRLHLPSLDAQRVRRASRLVRDYTSGCGSFIGSVPHLVLEVWQIHLRCKHFGDCIGCAFIDILVDGGPRCPRSGAEHRLKAIYGLIEPTEVQM